MNDETKTQQEQDAAAIERMIDIDEYYREAGLHGGYVGTGDHLHIAKAFTDAALRTIGAQGDEIKRLNVELKNRETFRSMFDLLYEAADHRDEHPEGQLKRLIASASEVDQLRQECTRRADLLFDIQDILAKRLTDINDADALKNMIYEVRGILYNKVGIFEMPEQRARRRGESE